MKNLLIKLLGLLTPRSQHKVNVYKGVMIETCRRPGRSIRGPEPTTKGEIRKDTSLMDGAIKGYVAKMANPKGEDVWIYEHTLKAIQVQIYALLGLGFTPPIIK